jgi:hypothetical protein
MFKTLLAAAAIAVAGTAAAAAPALASDNAQGTLYKNAASCGGATGQPAANNVGFVNVHLDSGAVHINYHLKDAKPNTTYTVWLYTGACSFDTTLGQVTTNDNGVGNADFTATVPAGTTQVFTYSLDSSFSQSVESAPVAP